VPQVDLLSSARISSLRNLVKGDYAVIMVNDELRIGQGISNPSFSNLYLLTQSNLVVVMYQKTSAKNGRHEPADITSNIAALSRIVLQVFEHSGHGNQFRSIPEMTALLQLHQHVLLPPTNVLTVLNTRPLHINNIGFHLSPIDMALFNNLKQGKAQLKKAMKDFRKREKVEDKP
jgi:hypothetical protein